jgi:3-mercaptopyruvate sulfurtransferase SseA
MTRFVTAADLVAEARANIREVAPADFHAHAGDAIVIDVREPAEFETGHIPGSINIPRRALCGEPAASRLRRRALDRRRRAGLGRSRPAAGGTVSAWPRLAATPHHR